MKGMDVERKVDNGEDWGRGGSRKERKACHSHKCIDLKKKGKIKKAQTIHPLR